METYIYYTKLCLKYKVQPISQKGSWLFHLYELEEADELIHKENE